MSHIIWATYLLIYFMLLFGFYYIPLEKSILDRVKLTQSIPYVELFYLETIRANYTVIAAQKRIRIYFWTGPFIQNNLSVSILTFANRDYSCSSMINLLYHLIWQQLYMTRSWMNYWSFWSYGTKLEAFNICKIFTEFHWMKIQSYTVIHNILMHTMHGMNTWDRFCNRQGVLLKPLLVGIRILQGKLVPVDDHDISRD